MKRLFQVNAPDGEAIRNDEGCIPYFRTKPEAKKLRDALNSGLAENNKKQRHRIGYGPDHWKMQS